MAEMFTNEVISSALQMLYDSDNVSLHVAGFNELLDAHFINQENNIRFCREVEATGFADYKISKFGPAYLILNSKGVEAIRKYGTYLEYLRHTESQNKKQNWNKYEGYLVNLAVALVSAFAATIFQEDLKPQLIKQNERIDSLRGRVDFLERHRTRPDSDYGTPISPVETRTISKELQKDSLEIEGMSKSNQLRKVNNKK